MGGEQRVGSLIIVSVNWFGRWRVLVCKAAKTEEDQENTWTWVRADNWRHLEPAAAALMLQHYGTLATHHGLPCPRSIARRATWQNWAKQNRAKKGGKL